MEKQIIFEDEHIRVIFLAGSSDELIFSFGDLITRAKGLSINAEKSLEKYNFNVIGIMPKLKSWFPEQSMLAMWQEIQDYVTPFQRRIGYGGSMGGYAAIKYANLFALQRVVALVPQYSIDPQDIVDLRYQMFFHPEINHQMRIKAEEISPETEYIVVYDPYYDEDRVHFEKIKTLIPQLHELHLPYTHHDAVAVLANSALLHDFLRHPFDATYFYQKMRHVKKRSKFYYRRLIERLLPHHPSALGMILKNNDLELDPQFFDAKQKQFILRALLKTKQVDQYDLLKLGIQVQIPQDEKRSLLMDAFGHGLVFNVISQKIESYAPKAIALNHKFLIPIEAKYTGLVYVTYNDERSIVTMNDRGMMKLVKATDPLGVGLHPLIMKKYSDYFVLSYKNLNLYSDEYGGNDFTEELSETAKFMLTAEREMVLETT
jgi:hypothetical protein